MLYPLRTKYTPTDQVYIFVEGKILPVTVTEWRTTVIADPNDSAKRIQQVWYRFAEVYGEIHESQVFSSRNHLKSYVTGRHLNRAILSGSGGSSFITAGCQEGAEPGDANWVSLGSWTDLAGFDLAGANWNNSQDFGDVEEPWEVDYENAVFDNSLIDSTITGIDGPEYAFGSTWPDEIATLAAFRDTVKSYDAKTTMWRDRKPIGLHLSGTVAGAEGGNTLTGTDTEFTTELSVGDTINVVLLGLYVVASIASDTSLTVASNFPHNISGDAFSGREISLQI